MQMILAKDLKSLSGDKPF